MIGIDKLFELFLNPESKQPNYIYAQVARPYIGWQKDAFTRDEADRFRPAVGSRDDLMLVKGALGRAAERLLRDRHPWGMRSRQELS